MTAIALESRVQSARKLRRPNWVVFGLCAGALVGLRRAEHPYADADVLWGARAGRDLLHGSGIPRADPYSWTAHGAPWYPNSWGWNVVLGIADLLGGLAGIAVLGVVMVGLLGLVVTWRARLIGAGTAWSVLCFQIVAGLFSLFLYARAQVVDYLAVLLVPSLVARAVTRSDRRWQTVALLAIAQVIWTNLHSAALIGPVLVLAAGIGLTARAPREVRGATARTAALCLAITALACLATPYGWSTVSHAAEVRSASAGLITEWLPAGFGSSEQILGVLGIVIAAGAAVLAWRARRWDTVATLLVLAIGSAIALRFAPMAALVAIPEVAVGAGRLPVRAVFVTRMCALALGVLSVVSLVGWSSFGAPGNQQWSPKLVAALPAHCRLLNDLGVGGEVILTRPDVPVSIDSRNDMYGRPAELTALRVLGDPTFGADWVQNHRVTCVLVPSTAPLVPALRNSADWRIVATDAVRTLLVRDPGK